MRPDMKQLLREARVMGFVISKTNGQHIRAVRKNPDAVVILCSTPQDYNSIANMRADLRRASNPNHPFGKRVHHER